jgi:hypothetical protein
MMEMIAYRCLICHQPVLDYVPQYCCDGNMCGCQAMPVEPCTCSLECDNALFDGIGKPYEQRRIKVGISSVSEN